MESVPEPYRVKSKGYTPYWAMNTNQVTERRKNRRSNTNCTQVKTIGSVLSRPYSNYSLIGGQSVGCRWSCIDLSQDCSVAVYIYIIGKKEKIINLCN